MSASLSLHSADSNSVIVRNYPDKKTGAGFATSLESGFATITVRDIERNCDMTLFFASFADVLNFSLVLQQEINRVGKLNLTTSIN